MTNPQRAPRPPSSRPPSSRATRRRKLARLLPRLEEWFGRPRWQGPRDPLDTLLSTILSQHTSDANSHRAFESLKRRFPDWKGVARADHKEVAEAIRSGGLANQKAERIQDVLRWVHREYGEFSLDALEDLSDDEALHHLTSRKGIGKKTAGIVLMFALGRDLCPVDTHIHRVVRRLGLVDDKATADKAHDDLNDLLPEGEAYAAHVNLIRFGRRICHARSPRCDRCPFTRSCLWFKDSSAGN